MTSLNSTADTGKTPCLPFSGSYEVCYCYINSVKLIDKIASTRCASLTSSFSLFSSFIETTTEPCLDPGPKAGDKTQFWDATLFGSKGISLLVAAIDYLSAMPLIYFRSRPGVFYRWVARTSGATWSTVWTWGGEWRRQSCLLLLLLSLPHLRARRWASQLLVLCG